jgi:Zn finger protein HypA/HybF involved in hydrogenase expression
VTNFTRIVHETHLFNNILKYLEKEEKASSRTVSKICVALSEFGGLSENHFLEHFKEASARTRFAAIEIEITKIPYGPEFEITKIEFT